MTRALRLLALATVATVALVAPALPAIAAGPVTVLGRVLDADDDTKLAGIAVKVYAEDPDEGSPQPIDQDVTDGDGEFSLEVPASGEYWFTSSDASGLHRTSTESESVYEGNYLRLTMPAVTGGVSGHVLDQFGEPYVNNDVELYRVSDDPEGEPFETFYRYNGGGGHFALTVPPGDYKLRILGGFVGSDSRW